MGTMNVVPIRCVKKQVKRSPKRADTEERNERNYTGREVPEPDCIPMTKADFQADHAGVR